MFKSGNLNPYTAIIIPTHEMVSFCQIGQKGVIWSELVWDSFVTGRAVIKNDCMRMNIFKCSIISFIIRYKFDLAIINVIRVCSRTPFKRVVSFIRESGRNLLRWVMCLYNTH